MTIQECYQQFGGDFDEVKKRLPNEMLIKKFIAKYLDDSSFSDLRIAMEEGKLNETIAVKNIKSGKIIRALVRSANSVEVVF